MDVSASILPNLPDLSTLHSNNLASSARRELEVLSFIARTSCCNVKAFALRTLGVHTERRELIEEELLQLTSTIVLLLVLAFKLRHLLRNTISRNWG